MKIIKPRAELIWITENAEKIIENCGRVCYKSEKTTTEDSSDRFIKMIIRNGHESVLEHASASFRFVCDRGVSHELVRHRLSSYTQECVSGDTKISKKYTIKDLYDRKNNKYGKIHNKTINLISCNESGYLIKNKIVDIFYKGNADIYEVKTKHGYVIKCTLNHEFMSGNIGSFKKLNDLSVGDKLFVNGRPCLIKIDDEELKRLYNEECLSPEEISKKLGCPYRSVLRKLSRLKLFVKKKNDKNKEKYNKNRTVFSNIKMRNTIINQYKNGRTVWNKGIIETEHPSVKKQGDSLRKHHNNNGFREKNSCWKGGKSITDDLVYTNSLDWCEVCKKRECVLETHHKNKDRSNNTKSNLIRVCLKCHNMLHHGYHVIEKVFEDEIISITFLGKEDVYDIEMEAPYHNYVANGFIVHNSTRFCNYSKNRFDGEISVIEPPGLTENERFVWKESCEKSEQCYMDLLKTQSPQIARSVLPTCLKTELIMTTNFREWRHILKLRMSVSAHPQIKVLMEDVYHILHQEHPNIFTL